MSVLLAVVALAGTDPAAVPLHCRDGDALHAPRGWSESEGGASPGAIMTLWSPGTADPLRTATVTIGVAHEVIPHGQRDAVSAAMMADMVKQATAEGAAVVTRNEDTVPYEVVLRVDVEGTSVLQAFAMATFAQDDAPMAVATAAQLPAAETSPQHIRALAVGMARPCKANAEHTPTSAQPPPRWSVYDGEELILTFRATPGPLLSVASPPPGGPPLHPFLTATSHSARHEHDLRVLLEASADADAFRAALERKGFRLVEDAER